MSCRAKGRGRRRRVRVRQLFVLFLFAVFCYEVFERVESEQLERSDFTIFTHDLKKTCDSYYATVKANLPSIAVEEVTDDEDDDEDAVAPVCQSLTLTLSLFRSL